MSELSIRLHLRRKELGLSQEELAARLGTTKQVVSRYENGQRTPKVTVVEAFARRLGVPLAALLGEAAAQSGALRVPVLGYVRAGIPLTAVEDVLDYEEVPPSLAHLGELFALKIKGDSMEPRMLEGDVVISLVANNPAYPPMFYTFEECESLPVRVVGQVIELRAKSF